MTAPVYTDAELFLAEWLHTQLDVKTWADPRLPEGWRFEAPLIHVQRSPGEGDTRLTLDAALIDVDVYAATAANARAVAERVRSAIRFTLPTHTGGGVFVTGTQTVTAPAWLPDPAVFRRTATYRLYLHMSF